MPTKPRAKASKLPGPPKRDVISVAEQELLRYAAETAYILAPGEVSLTQMATQKPYSAVSLSTLEKWARQGGWIVKRQEHLMSLRQQLKVRLGQRLIEDRVRELEDQQHICELGLDMLDDESVQPKSFEGVAQMVVGTYRNMDQLRSSLADDLRDGIVPESQMKSSQIDEPIHLEEARAAARALVQARQARLRAGVVPTVRA